MIQTDKEFVKNLNEAYEKNPYSTAIAILVVGLSIGILEVIKQQIKADSLKGSEIND